MKNNSGTLAQWKKNRQIPPGGPICGWPHVQILTFPVIVKLFSIDCNNKLRRGEISVANFRPSVTVSGVGNYICGFLHDFRQIGDLPVSPNGPIWKFSNTCTKSKFEKIANSCIWGPILWAVLKKKGTANWTRMEQFKKLQQFPVQNPNGYGVCFMKKFPTHVFEAPQCGPFRTNRGVCHSAKNGPFLIFFNNFMHKIEIKAG